MTGRERDHAGELVFMIREALMAIIRPQPFIAGLLTSIPINRSIPSSQAAEQRNELTPPLGATPESGHR